MIHINLTDEQGTLLGSTMLDTDDLNQQGYIYHSWIGEKILAELPSNNDALMKLLEKQQKGQQ